MINRGLCSSKLTRIIIFIAAIILIASCKEFKKNRSHQNVPDASIEKGQVLAATYCASCHLLPDPSLLDSKDWQLGVLPAMGPRLGIYFYDFKQYPSSRYDRNVDRNFYPSKQVISFVDWQNIIDYYTALAPDSMPAPVRKYALQNNSALFKIKTSAPTASLPTTCFVKIDTSASPHQLVVADMLTNNLYRFNDQLVITDSCKTLSPVVNVDIYNNQMITTNIGIMGPNNGKYGAVNKIKINQSGKLVGDITFKIDQLARPVQTTIADLNGDGKPDYLVCEFGNLTGSLSWMENEGINQFKHHVIRNAPGAVKAYVTDVNHDGLPDIWALFAQGEEGIFLFTNKGNGQFSQEQIIRFPPIYGSSYFELADFNKDGHPDILYTCGDNGDFSAVLKPYHGIYIYINDGSNHFKKQYFFAMHGCYKAMARDFDGDGDLDIAAISFFADYSHHPEESFIYLKNEGGLDFKPYTIPGTTTGRWMTMDAGDFDGDGKIDLVLGNFSVAPAAENVAAQWKKGPAFMVLKNAMGK